MRFDREMDSKLDSKPAQQPVLPKGRPTAVHLMAISNIARLDIGQVSAGPNASGDKTEEVVGEKARSGLLSRRP